MDLSQEEFLKFLNCRVVLKNDRIEKQTVLNAKNKPVTIVTRHGKFQSHKVKLHETAINNKIARIPLPRIKFTGDNINEIKKAFNPSKTRGIKRRKNISSYGRQIKQRKIFESDTNKTEPQHVISSDDSEILSPSPVRRKTFAKTPEAKPNNRVNFNASTPKVKQRNGSFIQSDYLKNLFNSKPPRTSRGKKNKDSEFLSSKESSFFLQTPKMKFPADGKLNYKFEDLILDIKKMELPSPVWKIKVIIRKNKIASIVFTNKSDPERSVSFSAKQPYFYITIDNREALLLGSPQTVDNVNDIEVLLNIVHNIDSTNSMILYKK